MMTGETAAVLLRVRILIRNQSAHCKIAPSRLCLFVCTFITKKKKPHNTDKHPHYSPVPPIVHVHVPATGITGDCPRSSLTTAAPPADGNRFSHTPPSRRTGERVKQSEKEREARQRRRRSRRRQWRRQWWLRLLRRVAQVPMKIDYGNGDRRQ
uniref:Uncharacterized protein n=1 Tax=Helianthus annuus TaxID=4232 RepID=A0A251RTU2_HELAN